MRGTSRTARRRDVPPDRERWVIPSVMPPSSAGHDMAIVTAFHFEEHGTVPNNPRLPVLFYVAAFPAEAADMATLMEERFEGNGWPPQWRSGIYDFQHYHTEGHEALGIAAGKATLLLGGERGREIEVAAGDVVLLPAGTGHRCLRASQDLLVIGAYPPGQSGDIVRTEATAPIRRAIARLAFPASDPVAGYDGPVSYHWSESM